jgi:hypothetical protein
LLAIHAEHEFLEHGQRNPGAGLVRSQGAVVVKTDTHGHGDSIQTVCGPHEQRVPEAVRSPRLSHHGERERPGIQALRRSTGYAHDTAQPFLDERERIAIDIDRRRLAPEIAKHLA